MRILFLSMYILLSQSLFGQSDTIYLSFPGNSISNTINTKVISVDNGYAILLYNFDDTIKWYSFLITNPDGQVIRSLDEIIISDNLISNIEHFEASHDGFLFFSNVILNQNVDAFISYRISLDLNEIEVIDTLFLDKDTRISLPLMKHNSSNGTLEGFGMITHNQTDEIENYFIQSDTNGIFMANNFLDFGTAPRIILDFVWISQDSNYFISFFNGTSALIDYKFDVLDRIENLFIYVLGEIEYHTQFKFYNCVYKNSELICAGSSSPANKYSISLCKFDVDKNNFHIKEVHPVFPEGIIDDVVVLAMTTDDSGNYISVGAGFMWPFGDNVDNNSLYLAKVSPEFEDIWKVTFSNMTEKFLRKIVTDKNGDIVVVGEHWSNEFYGQRRGYFLKVFSDGTFTSISEDGNESPDVMIYPNPAGNFINIDIKSDSNLSVTISSVS